VPAGRTIIDMSDRDQAPTTAGGPGWDGALRPAERRRVAARAVLAALAALPADARGRLRRVDGSAAATGTPPPDTRLCREASELVRRTSPPALLGHVLRCWLWADLIGRLDGVSADPETLYLACLLHDVALTDAHRPTPADPARCFAVHGGDVAAATLLDHGAAPSLAAVVADAVRRHMDPVAAPDLGPEARLLHAAATLDVTGRRVAALARADVARVLDAHPRDGFAVLFEQLMCREATERPTSRAGTLWRAGMAGAIRRNPLDRGRSDG
jgi:hypothetical protein